MKSKFCSGNKKILNHILYIRVNMDPLRCPIIVGFFFFCFGLPRYRTWNAQKNHRLRISDITELITFYMHWFTQSHHIGICIAENLYFESQCINYRTICNVIHVQSHVYIFLHNLYETATNAISKQHANHTRVHTHAHGHAHHLAYI